MQILGVNENEIDTENDFNGDHFKIEVNNESNNNGETMSYLFLLTFYTYFKSTKRLSNTIWLSQFLSCFQLLLKVKGCNINEKDETFPLLKIFF